MANSQGIRIEEETQNRLKWLAEKRDRSMNYLIKEAISRFLQDEEKYEREKLDDQKRLQHFMDTGEYVSHEAMTQKLQSLAKKAKGSSQ